LELIPPKSKLEEEYAVLKAELCSVGSPIVFCHNDLLLANIIHNANKSTVTFIDYEYSNYNYQAFDIGNHFAEFAGKKYSLFSITIPAGMTRCKDLIESPPLPELIELKMLCTI
jgi:aminoglycoside phosphotransferase (APT) family kinase protein